MSNTRVSIQRRSIVLAMVFALSTSTCTATDQAANFRTITWEALVPKGWDPSKDFRAARDAGRIKEGSAEEADLMQELRKIWDNAPTRTDLDGAKVRLPGFVVPIEGNPGWVKEFLLVPYFGACIHSPPPPANQIVHVVLPAAMQLRTMDPVWVSGTVRVRRQNSSMGVSGYTLDGLNVTAYGAATK